MSHVHVDVMLTDEDRVDRDDVIDHYCLKGVEEIEHAEYFDEEGRKVHRFVLTLSKRGKVTR